MFYSNTSIIHNSNFRFFFFAFMCVCVCVCQNDGKQIGCYRCRCRSIVHLIHLTAHKTFRTWKLLVRYHGNKKKIKDGEMGKVPFLNIHIMRDLISSKQRKAHTMYTSSLLLVSTYACRWKQLIRHFISWE